MIIQDNQIELRRLVPNDLVDRCRWLNDPAVTRFFTNIWAFPPTLAEMEKWLENIGKKMDQEMHFSIYTRSDNHIGGVQLKGLDWRNRSTELGLFIGEKEWRGKGLGTIVTHLLLHYAFMTLNLHRVWLRVDSENVAAIRCYEKCGFIREGFFRDEVYKNGQYRDSIVMSILSGEFLDQINNR